MSEPSASKIPEAEAVPLRRPAPEADGTGRLEDEESTTVVEEKPVPLRLGAERIEAEEREARLRVLTRHRSRWR